MSVSTDLERLSPEEFLARPDHPHFELVDGQLVELHVSILSSRVGAIVARTLDNHCAANDLGWVFGADLDYRCFPDDPDKLRKPDVSFIRRQRFGQIQPSDGVCRIRPDLVVEVVSKNDLAYEVDEKVKEYRSALVPLVWIVNPEAGVVRVHRSDGSSAWLLETDTLTGEDILPGFSCRVADLFPPAVVAP